MPYDTMSHVGLEADYYVTPEMLAKESVKWHYGWTWAGPERSCTVTDGGSPCQPSPCGLITTVSEACSTHEPRYAAAKQLHKASECPAGAS